MTADEFISTGQEGTRQIEKQNEVANTTESLEPDKSKSTREDENKPVNSKDYFSRNFFNIGSMLIFPELASKPVYYVTRDEIGRIVLNKVTGLANGEQSPVILYPLPGIVQTAR
jgi:hypothetical protein